MKIATDSVESFQLGVKETSKAQIAANAKAFEILSSTLYSNAILAIVRELCANAKDSHTAAGIPDTRFDVQIPNDLDPRFMVRDYGTGMTHEFVMNHLNTYFDSTKNNSNDEIGGFGLGIKCPFSYTSSFIISCFDGTNRRVYSYQIGSDGLPEIVFMAETPSTDAKGVEVSVPAKKDDYESFIYAAAQSVAFYDVKPKMRGMQNDLLKLDKLYEGTDWVVYKNNKFLTNSEYVEMGGVVYPVVDDDSNLDQRQIDQLMRHHGMPRHQAVMMLHQQAMMHWGRGHGHGAGVVMVFKAGIGDVNITPNREQLKMTDHTKAFLKAAKERLRKEVKQSVQDKFDACTGTFWEVLANEYADVVNTNHFLRQCNIDVETFTYKGVKLGLRNITFGDPKKLDAELSEYHDYYGRDHQYSRFNHSSFTVNISYNKPGTQFVLLPAGYTKKIPAAHFIKVVGITRKENTKLIIIESDKQAEIIKLFGKNIVDCDDILTVGDAAAIDKAVKDLKVYRFCDMNSRNYYYEQDGIEKLYVVDDFKAGQEIMFTYASDIQLRKLSGFLSSSVNFDAEAKKIIEKHKLTEFYILTKEVVDVLATQGVKLTRIKDVIDVVVKDIATEYAKKVAGMSLQEFIAPVQAKRKDICTETFIKAVKRWARECDRDDVRQMILAMEKDQNSHYMRRMSGPFKDLVGKDVEQYITDNNIKRPTVISNQFVVDLDTHAPLAGMLVRSYSQTDVCKYVKKEMAALAPKAKKKAAPKKKAAA